MTLDLHLTVLAVLVMGVAYVMTFAGVSKNQLEWKRRRRTCPSCGRHDGCSCAQRY
jgi:hypothetical protein